MKELQKVEGSLEKAFKGLPVISEGGKESVAKILPILALIGGVFQLAAAYWVFKLAHVAEQLDKFVKSYSVLTGGVYGLSNTDRVLIYVGAVVLLVEAVILLMSYGGLNNRKKRGWDLLFLAALINVAYSVVSLFISGRGFGSFLFGLIVSVFGLWLLFQVKPKYGAGEASKKDAVIKSSPESSVK